MTDEARGLLPIGRFARATGLTVKQLRHYAEIGLLRPAHVDEWTGYRYYSVAQTRTAAAILRLRGFEVPLAELAALLDTDDATLRQRLEIHRRVLAARLEQTSRVLDELDRVINGKEKLVTSKETPRLTVKEVPARTYVVTRGRVPMEELTKVIPRQIGETAAWLRENGGWTGAPMAVVGQTDDEGVVDLEVGWPVGEAATPPTPLKVVTYGPTRAIVHRHTGPYENLHQTYEVLERAMAAAGLRPTGPSREHYETDPAQEPDPEMWVTEIVWPVE